MLSLLPLAVEKTLRQVSMLPICRARLAQYRLSHCKSNKPLLSHKLKCSILPQWVLRITRAEDGQISQVGDLMKFVQEELFGGRFQRLSQAINPTSFSHPGSTRKGHEGPSIHGGDSRRSKILKLPTPKVLKARCSLDTKGVAKLLQRAMVLPKKDTNTKG